MRFTFVVIKRQRWDFGCDILYWGKRWNICKRALAFSTETDFTGVKIGGRDVLLIGYRDRNG